MERRVFQSPGGQPIDLTAYFKRPDDPIPEKLIFYDSLSRCFELKLDAEWVRSVLTAIFEKRPKAIRHSSGGFVNAQPTGLFLYGPTSPGPARKPEIRVRVKYRDLLLLQGSGSSSVRYVTFYQDCTADQLLEPFSYDFEGEPAFVLDLGRGPVPVAVYDYDIDSKGEVRASFIEWQAKEWLQGASAGEVVLVQRYSIYQDALRVASRSRDLSSGSSEWEEARQNYAKVLAAGAAPVPAGFRLGFTVEIPVGSGITDWRQALRKLGTTTEEGKEQTTTRPTQTDSFWGGMQGI